MRELLGRAREMWLRSLEKDRRTEGFFEAVSRRVWPWRESRLVALAVALALIDYVTTYVALEVTSQGYTYEGGVFAGWALDLGGFGFLFVVNLAAVAVLTLVAWLVRRAYVRLGFRGLGRAAFVALLVPYSLVALAAAINNLVVAFA